MTESHETDAATDTSPPDAGIELTIRVPLVLGPDDRNEGGIVVAAWDATTGKPLFRRKLKMDELDGDDGPIAGIFMHKLDAPVDAVLMCAYDGDDGEIMHTMVARPGLTDGPVDADGMPKTMSAIMARAVADSDEPCALCDESVPGGAEFDRTAVHRECLLANIIGPLGHHLDHDFWCENLDKPHAGLTARQGNIEVARLVERYGFEAVMSGEFPKDAPIGGEITGG